MNRLLGSQGTAGELDRAIRDDLVGVHVGLRAGAGLPDAQGEMVVEFSLDYLLGGLYHKLGFLRRQLAEFLVHFRAGALEQAECANDGARHPIEPDCEVQQRALGLRAPVAIGGDLDRAHAVGFGAVGTAMLLLTHDACSLENWSNQRLFPAPATVPIVLEVLYAESDIWRGTFQGRALHIG